MLYIAHRGHTAAALENTIPAFEAMIDHPGYDGVELDVQLARCGTPVVFHDDELDRIYGISQPVNALSAEQLGELVPLDVESYEADRERIRIPTLREALETLPDGPLINVEIKAPEVQLKTATRAASEVMNSLRRNYIVSSFNPLELIRLARYAPKIPRALLFGPETPYQMSRGWPVPILNRRWPLDAIHPAWELVSPDLIQRAHRAQLNVNVWTVNDRDRAEWLEKEGVDAIISDTLARTSR